MVNYDYVYRVNEIRNNIFDAIVTNYADDICNYDFSIEMLYKFKCKADILSANIDDGENFKVYIQKSYDSHLKCIQDLKEKKAM